MGIFEKILDVLTMMFGGTDYSKIAVAGDVVTGMITSFEARADATALTTLVDKNGDVLADCLNGQTLLKGDVFTHGKGWRSLTVSVGSIIVNGSDLVIS